MLSNRKFDSSTINPNKNHKSKIKLAETTGFEPVVVFNDYNGLANRRFQPLSHVSEGKAHFSF